MDLKDTIYTRRSVRKYKTDVVDRQIIISLIDAAIQAPSATNSQPWAFSVIQDKKLLEQISKNAKAFLLSRLDKIPRYERYRTMLSNPDFDIFYNTSTLLTVYAKKDSPYPESDCALAAQNIMLMAHAMGLGSCWIGFAKTYLNEPEIKKEFGISDEYIITAPIVIGYPEGTGSPGPKKEANVFFWK